jgi:hypothetical protein
MRRTSFRLAAAIMARQSSSVMAIGFSQSTWTFVAVHLSVNERCMVFGRAM